MNRIKTDILYEIFCIALFVCMLPIKIFAYIAPITCLVWLIIRSGSGKSLVRLVFFFICYSIIILFYYCIYKLYDFQFLIPNSFVALITYSSIWFFLIVPPYRYFNPKHLNKYFNLISKVLVFESLVGLFQLIIVRNTDHIQGTIGLFSMFSGGPGFGNQIFSINVALMLIFLSSKVGKNKDLILPFLIGGFILLAAGVVHVFISLILSVLISFIYFFWDTIYKKLSQTLSIVIICSSLLFALNLFFPNIILTGFHYLDLYSASTSPKNQAVESVIYDLPKYFPFLHVTGLGPGQYCSLAGLISTGEYFSIDMPFLANEYTRSFELGFKDILVGYLTNPQGYGNSTMHRPYFSILSLYSELGMVVSAIFLFLLIYSLFKLKKRFNKQQKSNRYYNDIKPICISTGILFIFFISFFENYLESSQSVFPGLLLLNILYNRQEPK